MTRSSSFCLLLVPLVALGAWLRVHDLAGQVLISDEWHALHAAVTCSYSTLAGLVTAGATSIPMNLYDKLLLDTWGWSEWTLRLPSVLSGIALVLLVPAFVARVLGTRVAVVAGAVVAVSPMLVYFSRYARPYSLAVALGFTCVLASYHWVTTGRTRWAVLFVGAGVVAAYVHLLELRMLLIPLGLFGLVALLDRVRRARGRAPLLAVGPGAIALAGGAAALAFGALMLPAWLRENERFLQILGGGAQDAATMTGAVSLLAGTPDAWLIIVLGALCVLGLVTLASRDALMAALVVVVVVGNVAVVLVTEPVRSHIPIVFARYLIPTVPLLAILVGAALDALGSLVEERTRLGARGGATVTAILGVALVGVLYLRGPLPRLYHVVHSFTNHKAYQGSYDWIDDAQDPLAQYRETMRGPELETALGVSDFYVSLAEEASDDALIEYPQPVGDVLSFYAALQRKHGRHVLGGYVSSPPEAPGPSSPGFLGAFHGIEHVLGVVEDPDALRFASLVDITDTSAVRASGARWLVIHHDPSLEVRGLRSPRGDRSAGLAPMISRYGEPVFADGWITVFDVAPPEERS